MSGPIALVKPELLRWARDSAGVRLEDAAKKADVTPERLSKWETGAEPPTIAQVRKLGAIYKRPLAVFFLPQPPKGWDAMHDTRRVVGDAANQSPALRLAIREAWERREVAVDLAGVDAETSFKVESKLSDDPEVVAERIRAAIPGAAEQISWRDAERAFTRWRAAIERLGILVFSFPDVNVEEVRGFSISAAPIQVIAINSGDMAAARTFTLMHELAHLTLRGGAVMCEPAMHDAVDVEVFCNHVAGAILVSRDSLVQSASTRTRELDDDSLGQLAREYSVSREVVARRLLVLGMTSQSAYAGKREQYAREFVLWRNKRKNDAAAKKGGPDYITTTVSRLGRRYMGIVLDAYAHSAITASDVSTYLGVKTKHIATLQMESVMRSHEPTV